MNTAITERLASAGQEHMLRHMELLEQPDRDALLRELRDVDLDGLSRLYGLYQSSQSPDQSGQKKVFDEPEVLSYYKEGDSAQEKKRLTGIGEDCLRDGRVAAFLVAGGQGTRLGFSGPKGCFPVSPVKSKTLFQLFAETIRALAKRYGRPLPWFIMTSEDNDEQTKAFFRDHGYFGLGAEAVTFLVQSQIPSLDRSGRLLLSPDRRLCKNPNGHGGSLYALHDSGALARMASLGVDEIFYFQVDNPLVKIADPLFIGAHVDRRADMSTKVVQKTHPGEKVGIIGTINGKLGCIEYSELSEEEASERKPDGTLRFNSANIAIHMLNRQFAETVSTSPEFHLPYHIAVKDIACLAIENNRHVSDTIKGIKFEMFVFDALSFARRPVTLEVPRQEEFAPVKNKEGADSPDTARAALVSRYRSWLRASAAGDLIPQDAAVEISPLYALDEREFVQKYTAPSAVSPPLYIE